MTNVRHSHFSKDRVKQWYYVNPTFKDIQNTHKFQIHIQNYIVYMLAQTVRSELT